LEKQGGTEEICILGGPLLTAGFFWMVYRLLAGPNVWDFQCFLTTRSRRAAISSTETAISMAIC
jgi:hypothetical protein